MHQARRAEGRDMADGMDEIGQALKDFGDSSRELYNETRAGGGTPVERRIADVFVDENRAFRALNDKMDAMLAETRRLHSRVEEMDTMRDDFRASASKAAGDYMSEYGRSLEALKSRSEAAISALEGLDVSVGQKYRDAVDDAARRITRLSMGAAAVIVLLAVAGGFWALVGASWFVRMSPEIQAWAASTPGLVAGIVVPVAIFAAGFFLGKDR